MSAGVEGEAVPLAHATPGLYRGESGALLLVTQYCRADGSPDAYVVDTGEYWWGGHSTREARDAALIIPVPPPGSVPAADHAAGLAEAEARGRTEERELIARELEEEADTLPCSEDAGVTRSNAALVRARMSYAAAFDGEPPAAPSQPAGQDGGAYQERVRSWLLACFGEAITQDPVERTHRFLEEALELGQATGCTAGEAHQLVDYVFGRPKGEVHQEIGGVMVCLAALCAVHGQDLNAEAERELARVWTKVEKIRAKHAAKPKFSPLPGASVPEAGQDGGKGEAHLCDYPTCSDRGAGHPLACQCSPLPPAPLPAPGEGGRS